MYKLIGVGVSGRVGREKIFWFKNKFLLKMINMVVVLYVYYYKNFYISIFDNVLKRINRNKIWLILYRKLER